VIAQPELERLVQGLAGSPEEWAHPIEHRADARTYAELRRDEDSGIWLICWMNDHATGYHDHDLSSGAVPDRGIEKGLLTESFHLGGGGGRKREG
jgi:hypothetical protein